MAKGILTNREVKNKVTGVDIYVSDYQEVPHRVKNEYLYHVIVVSNLFYYKTREHRESDVVQFMVSKTFAEFEDLYRRLFKRFPSVKFPPLPKKTLISANASANVECMDTVLKMVASTQKLSSSPMVISFLRSDSNTRNNVRNESEEDEDEEEEEEEEEMEVPVVNEDVVEGGKEENEGEFEDVDLFPSKQEEVVVEEVICTQDVENVSAGRSIFDDDEEEDVVDSTGGGGEDLFVTTEETKANTNINARVDILDLSDSDGEVDELMYLSKLSEKQSSIKVPKTQQPCKQRTNTSTKGDGNIFDHKHIENEDMFNKKSNQTNTKCLWGDHNHDTIEDIFGSKKTTLFDDDEGDDIFRRTSKKKVQVKPDEMKQNDIIDYIKLHDDDELKVCEKEKEDHYTAIASSKNDNIEEHDSLGNGHSISSFSSIPANIKKDRNDVLSTENDVVEEDITTHVLEVEEDDDNKNKNNTPRDVDIHDTGEALVTVIHYNSFSNQHSGTRTHDDVLNGSSSSSSSNVRIMGMETSGEHEDVAISVNAEGNAVESFQLEEENTEVGNDATNVTDRGDSLALDIVTPDVSVEEEINEVTEERVFAINSFSAVQEGTTITAGITDSTSVIGEQGGDSAIENHILEAPNS